MYVLQLVDYYISSLLFLIIVGLETAVIAWIYGNYCVNE